MAARMYNCCLGTPKNPSKLPSRPSKRPAVSIAPNPSIRNNVRGWSRPKSLANSMTSKEAKTKVMDNLLLPFSLEARCLAKLKRCVRAKVAADEILLHLQV